MPPTSSPAASVHGPVRPLVLSVLLVLVAGLTVLVPATAEATGTEERARAGGRIQAVITFDRNWRDQFDSRLRWRVWRVRSDGSRRLLDAAGWRAGSGLARRGGRNECVRNTGWAPRGRYSFVQYDDYGGNVIKGRAFYLSDKRCRTGTQRSQLFIHSEQGAGSTQCPDAPGDQACRWEFPQENDYRSFGCIKMAPGDLAALTRRFHRWFSAGTRYATSIVAVRVIN